MTAACAQLGLTRIPQVEGPLPENADSYPFSTMRQARAPFDPADFGYVEQEFLLSGAANVYDEVHGHLQAVRRGVPYVNRVLIRRPMRPAAGSGTVWVDILNASNGFDVEDNWRRAWNYWMALGHTYVGVTSKPVNVDALKNFDPNRYRHLSWDLDPTRPHAPVVAHPGTWDPFQRIPGAEEGLVWDILGQVGALLRDDAGQRVLGAPARRVFLVGQSQSAIYLNTWITHFHDLARTGDGRPLFDGYLPSVGSVLERPLRQQLADSPSPAFATVAGQVRDIDVPVITVSSEGDANLLGTMSNQAVLQPGLADGPLRRHWQVAGTPHTDLRTPMLPQSSEITRAGRLPRILDAGLLEGLNVVPLEPVITGAMAALERWVTDQVPAPPSLYLASRDGRAPDRDDRGNALGGVRLGVVDRPLGRFVGSDRDDPVRGSMMLDPSEEAWSAYPTAEYYRAECDRVDDQLQDSGYLEPTGRVLLHAVETELWQRAVTGIPAAPVTPQTAPSPTPIKDPR